MKKEKLALLLSTTILTGMLGGCGDSTMKQSQPDSNQEEQTQSDSEISNISTKQDAQVINLTDDTILNQVDIDYTINSYDPVNSFGYHLFQQNMQESSNPVLSPVSAYLALTMAGNGAKGTTREEFYNFLGKDEDMTVLADDMMNRFPQNKENLKLMLANSAWLDDEFTVNNEWLGTISSLFDAQAYQTNLSTQDAMNSMNIWIEDNTQGLIHKMIDNPLPDSTRLVLFNTLYFKGDWQTPFTKESTYSQAFTLADGSVIETEMMHQYEKYYDYLANDYAEGIIMPYRDSNLAFVALKPKDDMTVRDMYSKLTPEELQQLSDSKQESTFIDLTLPKFEVTFDAVLNDSLKNMGLQTAFDEQKADLSGLGVADGGGNLYISLVRQKAVVRVDEEGTEAAAATEVAVMESCALIDDSPLVLTFDEPFLYMIMDTDTNVPLFVGILDNPSAV